MIINNNKLIIINVIKFKEGKSMVFEKELKILQLLKNYNKDDNIIPLYFYNENKEKLGFSRATYYRKLETLKRLGLVIFKRNKLKITNKGLLLLKLFNNNENIKIENIEEELEKEELEEEKNDKKGKEFVIIEQDELKNIKNDSNFIYIPYPSTTYILKLILKFNGIDAKGLSTNAEKLNFILNCPDIKDVNLAVDYFENASKQALVCLRELILANKISKLYVSFKDIKKALKKKEILSFLQEFEFELKSEDIEKIEKDEVNLFNVFLLSIISIAIILSYRIGFQYAYAIALLLILYFARYLFVRNIRDEI